MDGYIMNTSSNWIHAMKRSVGPGAKISLQELYDQYGVKHEIDEGTFIDWLQTVKLRGSKKWKLILESSAEDKQKKGSDYSEEMSKRAKKSDSVTPPVSTKMGVEDVVNLSVRRAREVIPQMMDSQLLKYSLREANQLAGKDSLCKILRKRIQELSLSL